MPSFRASRAGVRSNEANQTVKHDVRYLSKGSKDETESESAEKASMGISDNDDVKPVLSWQKASKGQLAVNRGLGPLEHPSYSAAGRTNMNTVDFAVDCGSGENFDPYPEELPYKDHVADFSAIASIHPAWVRRFHLRLDQQYEIWPLSQYPDPSGSEKLGKSVHRFRFESDKSGLDFNPRDYPNLVKAAKQQVATQFPTMSKNDVVIALPRVIGKGLFLDVIAKTRSAYIDMLTADLSPFRRFHSEAPYPSDQIMLRVDNIDIGNDVPDILNAIRQAVGPLRQIIAFWLMYRKDTMIDDSATRCDFTGTAYALLHFKDAQHDRRHLPAFLSLKQVSFPQTLPMLFEGRPADCTQCSATPDHSAEDCPNKCKCGGFHRKQDCPHKRQHHNKRSRSDLNATARSRNSSEGRSHSLKRQAGGSMASSSKKATRRRWH